MTTWGDICNLPKWPYLTCVSPENCAAGFNTNAGTYILVAHLCMSSQRELSIRLHDGQELQRCLPLPWPLLRSKYDGKEAGSRWARLLSVLLLSIGDEENK